MEFLKCGVGVYESIPAYKFFVLKRVPLANTGFFQPTHLASHKIVLRITKTLSLATRMGI